MRYSADQRKKLKHPRMNIKLAERQMLKHFGKEALMVDGHSREELVVLRYWEAKREVPLH